MITCEFTAHGNICPDVHCILDHTLVIVQEKEVEFVATTIQLILWNTKTGFGRAE
jgi:hypothetical protein